MVESSTIIPVYSPLDGIGQHWNDFPEHWNGGWDKDPRKNPRKKPSPFWNVKEVEKTAEIKDNFDFERFKVYLYSSREMSTLSSTSISFPDENDQAQNSLSCDINGWRVTVTSLLADGNWEPIFDSKLFLRLEDATRCYDENVREYSLIAKVETRHFQDIRIYAEKIGYHRVEKCCANCRWCQLKKNDFMNRVTFRQDKFMHDPRVDRRQVAVCTNFKLFTKRTTDLDKPDFDCGRIQPEVDLGCVCDSFEKRLPPHDPRFPNHCYDQYGDVIPSREIS